MPLTMYSFGYWGWGWGWGNHTEHLIQAIDAVERHRGFRPPIFVDIRISRAVRAKGFSGNAFEQTIGKRRYGWMQDLGNEAVLSGTRSKRMRIRRPAAAADLLQLAQDAARERRHVICFCNCPYPYLCHRHAVARLLVRLADRQGKAITVTEWPGGEPSAKAQMLPGLPGRTPKTPRVPLGTSRPLQVCRLALSSE